MKPLWYLTLAAVIASASIAITGCPTTWIAISAAIAVATMIWLWFATILPVKKASLGIQLIRGEEYNNRLAPSHDPGASRIVKVFNNLMDRLSDERLRLEETNNLLELLVKASPMGIALMDYDNRFSLVNDAFCKMTACDSSDLIGSLPKDYNNPLMSTISRLRDSEETTIKTHNTEIYRISRLSFVKKGFRRPFILIEKLTDEIRRAEKETYSKVIRTISHEVNNTIGGLRSFLESLTEINVLDEELNLLCESCIEGSTQLVEFINGYADVVRIGEPVMRKADLNDTIRIDVPFLKSIVGTQIQLDINLCKEQLLVEIDRAMMRQMLLNIVKNAAESIVESRRSDGHICIRTTFERTGWTLEVEDNGIGISEDEAARIFTPFFTTKKRGQGLGLTLTAEILRKHHLAFSLSTIASGRTIFHIESF